MKIIFTLKDGSTITPKSIKMDSVTQKVYFDGIPVDEDEVLSFEIIQDIAQP